MAPERHLIGVDVGTSSARAGVFDAAGHLRAAASRPIAIWHDEGGVVEQSSADIWAAVCAAVRKAVARAGIGGDSVAGIGFDATCSMVVLGAGGVSLPVGPSGDPQRDVIVWMDHRAIDPGDRINAGGHAVLRHVGGRISPEMQTPKLLWLAEHRPQVFGQAWQFFDLVDFLTWKATGALDRSACTVTCKWTYLAHEGRWDAGYFRAIGLGVLADEGFRRIGARIVSPGTALAAGLTAEAAGQLGLPAGTPVGAGLIDAHAGGLGTVGLEGSPTGNVAYVFGTSSCTMTSTRDPVFVPGVWGPYHDSMVPGLWLNEGGQSAAGAAIEQLLLHHPAAPEATAAASADGLSLPAWLARRAEGRPVTELIRGLHVVPEFLGNRAPLADPRMRAVIAGLGMERDVDSLLALYLAGLTGIGYGLRQILDAQDAARAPTRRIVISGGAGSAPLVRQLLADAAARPLAATDCREPVLLGAAILGGVAGGVHPDVPTAMAAMTRAAGSHLPDPATAALHAARHAAYLALQSLGREIRDC
ncbi:FGGY-family carbohydrate kinase [Paracoccus sphaerophysae]|uniref:Ribulokinase n=1 Tax=Paracoccus sphaerophysae TaxID=690417 RepID=A0A099FEA1_9RHOB|nr:FGGY-family carbohydrate kinase [Paracoccus sphaerophysae]KGJ08402.1 ribulokinase [Paracoccus sphaerophysae]